MSERCPLLDGSYGMIQIPDMCREQCESIWDGATRPQTASHNEYDDVDTSECSHNSSEFSHETLQEAAQDKAGRILTIVEACINCGTELGEDSYVFTCPNE